MNTEELKQITEKLLSTFIKAGQKSLDLRKKGLKKMIKADNTSVTNGDIEIDRIIRHKISIITPNIPLISEETVDIKKKNFHKNFWLIDPIDGTSDYIKNKDEFTLNASLIINLEPVLGIIYAPAKKRLFYSYGYGNAFENFGDNKIKLECKKKNKNNKIIAVSYSSTPSEEITNIYKKYYVEKFINMRSSYKFCVIASGEFDIYVAEARAFEWDIAAGHAIVLHAGGIVTTLEGNNFKYGKPDYKNYSLLVKRSEKLSE